uniref:Uncharacterized protein n=1 Tax=Davidia involucrata TaxID=16924 RepID=A0A5B6Z4K1_DAVIN
MDISSPLDMSVSEDQSSLNQPQCTCGDVSLNDLGDGLTELLHIQGDQKLESNSILFPPSNKNDISNVEKDNVREETDKNKNKSVIVTSDMCLCKCATFPCSGETTSCAASTGGEDKDGEDEDELDEITPLKLVSAIKGSREKQGMPPKKLTVTWAPDVYDPPPTALSHVATSKKQRHRSDSKKSDGKKNGKNKQKGGGGKLARGKDKKQARKYSGSSNKCFKSLDDDDRVVEYNEPYADLVDFDVGSPDSYCGSSFLKKSVSKMHYSVAEAT